MNLTSFLRSQWDRAGAWICITAGAVVLFAGWWGISGTTEVGRQLPYVISGGLAGVFLLGLGGMLWVSADLRDEWRELWAIRGALAAIAEDRERAVAPVAPVAPAVVANPVAPADAAATSARPASPPRHRHRRDHAPADENSVGDIHF
jgi:hypothetical protein